MGFWYIQSKPNGGLLCLTKSKSANSKLSQLLIWAKEKTLQAKSVWIMEIRVAWRNLDLKILSNLNISTLNANTVINMMLNFLKWSITLTESHLQNQRFLKKLKRKKSPVSSIFPKLIFLFQDWVALPSICHTWDIQTLKQLRNIKRKKKKPELPEKRLHEFRNWSGNSIMPLRTNMRKKSTSEF